LDGLKNLTIISYSIDLPFAVFLPFKLNYKHAIHVEEYIYKILFIDSTVQKLFL